MNYLVLGGSKSGKSYFAEKLATDLKGEGCAVYLATLAVKSPLEEEIVKRHRAQRAWKGFITVEKERDILSAFPFGEYADATVLLEDLTNLYANEMFGAALAKNPGEIAGEIMKLKSRVKNLIVVSNNIFCDGLFYEKETVKYIEDMGKIHRELAKEFDCVSELVCGIEVKVK